MNIIPPCVEEEGDPLNDLYYIQETDELPLWARRDSARAGYDKSPNDEKFALEQYQKAEPWLNLISSGRPYGQVSEDEVDRLRRELEEKAGETR